MLETIKNLNSNLADLAIEKHLDFSGTLDWVGMQNIEIPLKVENFQIPGRLSAFVSLDKASSRGIHMSRLFKITQEKIPAQNLNFNLLRDILKEFLKSHQELSHSAKIAIQFEAMIERHALKSNNRGWRSYPITLFGEIVNGKEKYELEVMVTYSSTCPQSAALARQLVQENFKLNYKNEKNLNFDQVYKWLGSSQGINATPHAQRSFANVKIALSPENDIGFIELIDLVEETLQTPVQTVVKREDEQEFALRNGQNLMFCEDAARRLKKQLGQEPRILFYSGRVRHVESLHPHDAVSFFSSDSN